MSLFTDNSLIRFIMRHPDKVFFLDAVSPYRNTAGQWKCVVHDKRGRRRIMWCELPEMDALMSAAPPIDMGLRGSTVDGKGKSLWQGLTLKRRQ